MSQQVYQQLSIRRLLAGQRGRVRLSPSTHCEMPFPPVSPERTQLYNITLRNAAPTRRRSGFIYDSVRERKKPPTDKILLSIDGSYLANLLQNDRMHTPGLKLNDLREGVCICSRGQLQKGRSALTV